MRDGTCPHCGAEEILDMNPAYTRFACESVADHAERRLSQSEKCLSREVLKWWNAHDRVAEELAAVKAELREIVEAAQGVSSLAHWHTPEFHKQTYIRYEAAIARAAKRVGGGA